MYQKFHRACWLEIDLCILRTPTYGFAKQNGRDAERAD